MAAACVPSMRSSFRDGRAVDERSVDATGLVSVQLDAGVGDVELSPASTDSVRVQVTVRSSDAERLARDCLPNASLGVERQGGVLVVRLEQRTRNRCGSRWRLHLPPSLAVRVRADLGTITATGLTGALDVETGNGNIDVQSHAPGHGAVLVRSDVGRVAVRVRGYDVPPTSRRGAGQEATVRGPGGPDITLRTRNGRASLVLAAAPR